MKPGNAWPPLITACCYILLFCAECNVYLKAVLVSHELLGFALVSRLGGGSHGLCGERAACSAAAAFGQIQVGDLHADLITHYMLQLYQKIEKKNQGT